MRVKLNQKSLLILLVTIDLLFIILYIFYKIDDNILGNHSTFLLSHNFSISRDGSYSEIFQYVKEGAITIMLFELFTRKREVIYLAWGTTFSYLLLDDSLQLHERLGLLIGRTLEFSPMIGLRTRDFGELTVSAIAGIFLLSFIAFGYYLSQSTQRKISQHLLFLLLALAFFGIIIDMVHAMVRLDMLWKILAVVEDGGEMVIMSIVVWYVFGLFSPRGQKHGAVTDHNKTTTELSDFAE